MRAYTYFPERALGWNGVPIEDLSVFEAAVEGFFDLAIDLRVDDDTRHLLAHVDAAVRCGIGSKTRYPLLDVALPSEHQQRAIASTGLRRWQLDPERFNSGMKTKTAGYHEAPLVSLGRHLIYGPYMSLPLGRFLATFGVEVVKFVPHIRGVGVTLDIVRDGTVVAQETYGRARLRHLNGPAPQLEFENLSEESRFEFRVNLSGRALSGRIRFTGVDLRHISAPAVARFRPAELHIGEQLSLLVSLIKQRVTALYEPAPAMRSTGSNATPPLLRPLSPGTRRIVIAPISNSTVRDWPIERYLELIGILIANLDCSIVILGSAAQTEQANVLEQAHAATGKITNLAGRTQWRDLPDLLRLADLVICNNSGIAHQAASLGVPTLAIYSGSHQPPEWGPRGIRAFAVMAPISCSPCGFEQLADCPFDHACMKMISASYVATKACEMMGLRMSEAPEAAPPRLASQSAVV